MVSNWILMPCQDEQTPPEVHTRFKPLLIAKQMEREKFHDRPERLHSLMKQ